MTSIQWAERCSVNAHFLRPIETEAAALIWKKFKICLIALTRYHFLIIVFVNRFTHLHRIWITKWGTERGLWTFGIHSHWQVCILNLEPECELFIMLVSIYLFLATNPLLFLSSKCYQKWDILRKSDSGEVYSLRWIFSVGINDELNVLGVHVFSYHLTSDNFLLWLLPTTGQFRN